MDRNLRWLLLAAAALWGCDRREPTPTTAPTSAPAAASPGSTIDLASVERLAPAVARERVQAGQALLVCAYADARCAELALEGSIPFSALQARLPQLPRDQGIILYCD